MDSALITYENSHNILTELEYPFKLLSTQNFSETIAVPAGHVCITLTDPFDGYSAGQLSYFHGKSSSKELTFQAPTLLLLIPAERINDIIRIPPVASFFSYWFTSRQVEIPMANYEVELPHLYAILAKPRSGTSLARSVKVAGCASLLLIVRQLLYERLPLNPQTDQRRFVARFIELVEGNYHQQAKLKFYAEALSTGEQYLGELCRDKLGQSAKEIIQLRRIQEAKEKLSATNLTIKEIAFAIGFEDQNYFSRFFRAYTGVSPIAYRRQE